MSLEWESCFAGCWHVWIHSIVQVEHPVDPLSDTQWCNILTKFIVCLMLGSREGGERERERAICW